MTDILLTSPDFIRSMTNISDNVNGKVLMSAIREAQDIDLQEVIGTCMLEKLKNLVDDEDIDEPENIYYKLLLNESQYFIAYTVVARICILLNFKIDNAGVFQTSDENITNINLEETFNIQEFYQRKADFYIKRLQEFIRDNIMYLPEISEACYCKVKSNLYSSANANIWLGGRRGKGESYKLRVKYNK